jgi:hypothetical protein
MSSYTFIILVELNKKQIKTDIPIIKNNNLIKKIFSSYNFQITSNNKFRPFCK